jgi:hypothetical protein
MPHDSPATPHLPAHRAQRQAIGQRENDPGAYHVAMRGA